MGARNRRKLKFILAVVIAVAAIGLLPLSLAAGFSPVEAPSLILAVVMAGAVAFRARGSNKTGDAYLAYLVGWLRKERETDRLLVAAAIAILIATTVSCSRF